MPDGPSNERGAARRYERVFMLRIWSDPDGCSDATRGSIVEIESGRRLFFSGLAALHDFLRLRLGAS